MPASNAMKTIAKAWNTALNTLFPKKEKIMKLENLSVEGAALDVLPCASRELEDRGIFPLFDYRNERVRAIVWEIKYRRNHTLADFIADSLHDEIFEYVSNAAVFDGGAPPLLIPVPMSTARRKERGYNQTEFLAERLRRRELGRFAIYRPNALSKHKHTPSQTGLTRAERLENLRGAYSVPVPALIAGRTVILIDDVTTTGATIAEIRKTLLEAGASNVVAFTIAH